MKKVIILGAGGFARELHSWIDNVEGVELVGFYADVDSDKKLNDYNIYSDLSGLKDTKYVLGVGDVNLRQKFAEIAESQGLSACDPLVHPSVVLGKNNSLAQGVVLTPGCIVTTNVTLEKNVMINIGSTVGHDCTIGELSVLSPGCRVSGNVEVGKRCDLGTGCSIRPKIHIVNDVVVGMNAAVVSNLNESGVYIGIPAKKLSR